MGARRCPLSSPAVANPDRSQAEPVSRSLNPPSFRSNVSTRSPIRRSNTADGLAVQLEDDWSQSILEMPEPGVFG